MILDVFLSERTRENTPMTTLEQSDLSALFVEPSRQSSQHWSGSHTSVQHRWKVGTEK